METNLPDLQVLDVLRAFQEITKGLEIDEGYRFCFAGCR